jgi:hypothetical protein
LSTLLRRDGFGPGKLHGIVIIALTSCALFYALCDSL